jgi:phosphomevalonate kinase
LLASVEAFRRGDRRGYDRLALHMEESSRGFIAACRRDDAPSAMAALDAYGALMEELGERSGGEIVDGDLRAIRDLARGCGGAGKPSGAGGGDLALCAFLSADAAADFARRSAAHGYPTFLFAVAEIGVHAVVPR